MHEHIDIAIRKSIRTAALIDGFWARWLVHGMNPEILSSVRERLTTLESWTDNWEAIAYQTAVEAQNLRRQKSFHEAEHTFRLAALYYNLAQWIFPENCPDKRRLYQLVKEAFRSADDTSPIETRYDEIHLDDGICVGRIRIPKHPVGCIVIINPIDSSKEELFLYEQDFLEANFAVVSFDGPGQGDSYIFHDIKATETNWRQFVDRLIEYAASAFPSLPLFLFGTSFGASWVVYGSCDDRISKSVAVSPAFDRGQMSMPDYFNVRMDCIHGEGPDPFPNFAELNYKNPVFLFHGGKDQMVKHSDIYWLYDMLPSGKQMIEYPDEMHCCNYKLGEIRKLAIQWYNAKD
ncbi:MULTISPECIES: alpha/beta hydrolase [Alicyclobacillus]|uniref:Alpha/beta hydrolase n=1 Tax=Alicyclobacillus acidoterrestris (strain ATCC 49025 / DSM 3922 / CIP 106132 / NCIMB 13137 / GD3B) TaxID=1356854 RepID=T0CZ07_ALIAG|nr:MULTISPECIES: alpha/beta hydrolase [Alicyclobacillus]EPZ44512.1 hypothetical protein N007_10865 [Alicyclobacillus acidoterrestris ATCC 49025]UNO49549.1 alpha/beta hydrolase [Alicyclobacillus acidoterrestris]